MRNGDKGNKIEPKLVPGDTNYVGRGHPPKHGQIKPNEIRNPYGRRGKPRLDAGGDFAAQMTAFFAKQVRAKDGRILTLDELAANALTKKLAEGDMGAIKFFYQLREEYSPKPSALELSEMLEETREDIVAEAVERLSKKDKYGDLASIDSTKTGGGSDPEVGDEEPVTK